MTYEYFRDTLMNCVREKTETTETTGEVCLHRVPKNNGVVLDSLVIRRENQRITPSISINQFYESYLGGTSIESIADTIIHESTIHSVSESCISQIPFQFEDLKDQIFLKLVNTAMNQDLLRDIPHTEFLDLSCIFFYRLPEFEIENATVMIKNDDLKRWNITSDDLWDIAYMNTMKRDAFELKPIQSMIQEMCPDAFEEGEELAPSGMYILTNKSRTYGSVGMLSTSLFQEIADLFHENLLILPSSVHELIVLPDNGMFNKSDLNATIREVNQNEVDPTEVLSDHYYYFDRYKGRIIM